MSAVKPKPRSAGHFYATGNHLIDAANQLFLATVNQDVDKVDVDKVDVDKVDVDKVDIDKVESEAEKTSSQLEIDIVDEELGASDFDLRNEDSSEEVDLEEGEDEEDEDGEEQEELPCESPPPSYHSPPFELRSSAFEHGHTTVQLLDLDEVVRSDPEEETMPSEQNTQNLVWLVGLGAIVAFVAVAVNAVLSSHHTIQEGSVGIYFKFGALGESISYPGVHWQAPFVSTVEEVRIRPQTDSLNAMEAITKDGITNTFNDVQVISRIRVDNLIPMVRKFGLDFRGSLIFDRVKEELRIFCANHTIDEVYNTK